MSHFIFEDGYEVGMWKDASISGLETSHLLNIKAMLLRHRDAEAAGGQFECATKIRDKINEIDAEINTRPPCVVEKHELRISHQDIVELAKSKGMKVPKTGAGVYHNGKQITEVVVKFDVTKPLTKPKKRKK